MEEDRDATPLPASWLTAARRARSAALPEASTVTRMIAVAPESILLQYLLHRKHHLSSNFLAITSKGLFC